MAAVFLLPLCPMPPPHLALAVLPPRYSTASECPTPRVQGRALQTAPARSLQQRDEQEYGNYRVVSVEVFERERCYLDEFAISAPPCSPVACNVLYIYNDIMRHPQHPASCTRRHQHMSGLHVALC